MGKRVPPHNLTVYKGMKNVVITREFAAFCLYDPLAIDLFNWLAFAEVPDELFFQTLVLVNRTEYEATGRVEQDFGMVTNAGLMPRLTTWERQENYSPEVG